MKIPLQQRLDLGHRVLAGEKVSALAREFGLSRETVTQCATEFLYCLQDFDAFEFRRILRTTQLGQLQSAVVLYARIRERAAPGTPGVVWHCGLRLATTRSLVSAGIESREQVLKAYREGGLGAGQNIPAGKKPGLGASRMAEIALWLGETPPARVRNRARNRARTAAAEDFRSRGVSTPAM